MSANHQRNHPLRVILLVVAGLLCTGPDSSSAAASLVRVQLPLLRCFRSADPASCEQALVLTEAMQVQAADRELYPCQTLLLGLQAEVVMVQLGKQRIDGAMTTVRESERVCAGL